MICEGCKQEFEYDKDFVYTLVDEDKEKVEFFFCSPSCQRDYCRVHELGCIYCCGYGDCCGCYCEQCNCNGY